MHKAAKKQNGADGTAMPDLIGGKRTSKSLETQYSLLSQRFLSTMLDSADRKILKLLQSNGRMTNQELATQCNISPSACHERFKRLRDEGYILGFSTVLDAGKLNKAFLIYVQVRLSSMSGSASEDFTTAARDIPDIMECYMIIGGFDYLLKIRVADLQAYRSFMGDTLSQMPWVREIRSFAVLEEVKYSTALPL